VLSENGYEIATQGHSVIHFAINHRPTRGSISSYDMAGLALLLFGSVSDHFGTSAFNKFDLI